MTALSRTRRRPVLAVFSLLLIAPILTQVVYTRGLDIWYAILPRWKFAELIETGSAGGPVAALRQEIRDPRVRGGRAIISCRGRNLLAIEDTLIEFGQRPYLPDGTRGPHLGANQDMNGDGIPELVIFAYSGGAHCCYTVTIIELSDPPVIVATIDAQNGMGLSPAPGNSPDAGQIHFQIADQSFDYWNAPHVNSPMPSVFYHLRNHRLEITLDRMLTPPSLSDKVLNERAEYLRKELSGPTPSLNPDMWSVMLDLLYSGHEDMAWKFLDACWPPDYPGKDAFKSEFSAILARSQQWKDFSMALASKREAEGSVPK